MDALKKAKGPVEVVLWHGLGVQPKKALDDMVKKYNASQSKVKIVALQQGTSYDEVLRKYESASAESGMPGMIFVEDTTVQTMIDGGTIFPSEACMKATGFDVSRYQAAVRSYYTVDGVFWPGYVNVSQPILYFNSAHFAKAGLTAADAPKTLDELSAVAKKLKAAGIAKPIALKLDEWYFESWINGAGEPVVNNDDGRSARATKASVNNPKAVEILTKLKKMQDDGLLQSFSDTDGQINQFLALASGQSTMTIETSAAASTIKAFLGGTLEEAQGQTAGIDTNAIRPESAPFPGLTEPGKARVSGGAFYIVSGTKSQKMSDESIAGAWDFYQFMSKPENVVQMHIESTYLPVISPAEDDPKLAKFWKDDIAGRLVATARKQLDTIDPKKPGPRMGPYPEYVVSLRNALDRVMFSNEDPKKSLDQANGEINKSLGASG